MHGDELLNQYTLISEQVSRGQVSVILRELERTLDLTKAGAIVEFGCYIGTTSLFIRRLLDVRGETNSREYHVYDSFEGLPAKTSHDEISTGEQFQAGQLVASKKEFMRQFQKAGLALPFIHKNWFSHLDEHDIPEKISFAFLDGDFYESIRDSLQIVLQYLTPQATIVIDDYSREALPGVSRAVHEFLPREWQTKIIVEHNLAILRL